LNDWFKSYDFFKSVKSRCMWCGSMGPIRWESAGQEAESVQSGKMRGRVGEREKWAGILSVGGYGPIGGR
jgi:hypothetical protein